MIGALDGLGAVDWTDVLQASGQVLKTAGGALAQPSADATTAQQAALQAQMQAQLEQQRAAEQRSTVELLVGGLVLVVLIVGGVIVAVLTRRSA